jgi:hypothetical protein
MKIPKYIQLLDDARTHEAMAKQKLKEAQNICPHSKAERQSYCDDDYAQCKTYTVYYKCPTCGLCSSSDKNDPIYIKMEEQDRKRTAKKYGWKV